MTESIAIEEPNRPLQEADDAPEDAEQHIAHDAGNAPLGPGLAPRYRAQLPKELHNGHEQTSQANRTEAVGERTPRRTSSRTAGKVVRAEVPGTVHAGYRCMDSVLDPFGDPVHGERDEDDEANHFAVTASSSRNVASGVVARRLVLGVDGDEGNGIPGSKGHGDNATNEAHDVGVSIFLANIHAGLEHQRREWDARYPRPEGKYKEGGEDRKHDRSTPIMPPVVEYSGTDGPAYIEDARHPDELLGKKACQPDIGKREDDGDDENEDEEDYCIGIERKGVAAIVDATALDVASLGIGVEGDS